MKRLNTALSSIVFLFLLSTNTFSQKPELAFEKIFDNNDKSIGYITDITQDKTGFIWFTTLNGLFRYDGYELKVFRNIYDDSTSLPFNSFQYLFIDSNGVIWLTCRDIDGRSDKNILSFNPNIKGFKIKNIASEDIIDPAKILEDSFNNLWISTYSSGLHRYNRLTGKSEMYCRNFVNYKNELYSLIDSFQPTNFPIAEITQVTNYQNIQKEFSIDKETPVIIISIGEGDNSLMYDFGFMTSGNDTVWQMKSENTRSAGGDMKNRIEIKIDTLKKGDYTLHYISDDSHSYGSWNSPEPDVLDFYGIRIYKINNDLISKLQTLSQKVTDKNKIFSNGIRDMVIDTGGKLWILTFQGISEYNNTTESFINHDINFGEILNSNVRAEGPQKMYIENDKLWFTTNNKILFSVNIKNHNYKVYSDSTSKIYGFQSIKKNKNQQFLLSGYNSLFIFDTTSNAFYHYKSDENNLYNGAENFFEDKSGTYWVSSYEGINKAKEKKFDYSGLFGVYYHKFLKHTYLDKSNTLWYLGSHKNLFSSFNVQTKSLKEFSLSDKNLPGIVKNNPNGLDWINFIYEDSKSNLWIAVSNGLFNFNRNQGKITSSAILTDSLFNRTKNEIVRIYEDIEKNLWVFSYKGIYLYNYATNKLDLYSEFNLSEVFLSFSRLNNIDYIFEDDNKTLWLRTYDGLFTFEIKNKKINKIISFENEYCNDVHRGNIYTDEENNLWIATFRNLYKINLKNKNVSTFTIRDSYRKVEWNVGYRYYKVSEDKNENLWISTGYGLVKFDKKTEEIKIYTDKQGLAGNNIQDYDFDARGMIWPATDEGISRFDPVNEIFTYYKETYYLSHDTRMEHQYINSNELSDGSLLFFTTYGIVSFNPDNYNKNIPPVVITKFSLFENEFPLDTIINLKKQIKLNYRQNFFSFEFAALDFANSEQNRYRYKLEGVDENWTSCDARLRVAKYTNVSPGEYIFKVKGSNSDGVWNEEGTSIRILISPPWYKTILAYIIYAILFFGLIYFVIKVRERKLKIENEYLEKIVEERTAEVLQQKEEITAQRDDIISQRNIVINQKEEIEAQRDLVTTQKEQIQEIHKEVTDSINYAKRLQNAAFPSIHLIDEYFKDIFILFKPKDIVSGDFYWFAKVENQIVITVADCTGHGVPGAFMSMLGISLLKEIVINEYITQPAIILQRLRKQIIKALGQTGSPGEQKDGMDISLCSINTDTHQMQWAGANSPCLIIRDGQLIELKADKMPIAIYDKMDKFTNLEIQLQKDDVIYLASDGYTDQFGGPNNKKFMAKHFKDLLITLSGKPMAEQKEIIDKTIEAWENSFETKHEQTDDITIMGLRIS